MYILILNRRKKKKIRRQPGPFIQMQICFFDIKKNRKLVNTLPSLHFYGMIILGKTKPLCIGMAWLPFQKVVKYDALDASGKPSFPQIENSTIDHRRL